MKLSRTVGLAVAISLVAATVAVSLVKPLHRTEQFEKRAHAVPPFAFGNYPWPPDKDVERAFIVETRGK